MTVETKNAILKGTGRRPTSQLLRWRPSLRNPFHFDLLEIMRCDTDGEVVTYKSARSLLGTHCGHKVKSPSRFSLWDFLKVQLGIIE